MRVLAVYVGKKSQINLRVGLAAGIWGFKAHQPHYDDIRPDDLILLASEYSGGSPRVQLEDWLTGSVATIELGVITSPTHVDHDPVWPDEHAPDTAYPYRFRFEHRGRIEGVSLTADGPLGKAVSDALRRSAIAQGRAYLLEDPKGFTVQIPATSAPTDTPDPIAQPTDIATVEDVLTTFEQQLDHAGIKLRDDLPLRFICGLMAKPFVILTGLSGSGKTQLAMALGRWLGGDRVLVSAVRPDWTGAEALFGYENLLLPPSADGRAAWSVPKELHFMLEAADDPTEPYLLLLDEMNLAHVERYFADVLSGMESGADVLPNVVQEEDGIWRVVPGGPERLPFPSNLLVVGTVNMDETTYQFSPKVLDRSTSIEFRVQTDSLVAARPDLTRIHAASSAHRAAFVDPPVTAGPDELPADLRKRIADLHRLLSGHGREFGHRTFQEMLRFAALALDARPALTESDVLDHLVLQKVLPRVHGSSRELSRLMADLRTFTVPDEGSEGDEQPAVALPLAADKLARMTAELEATHFTAF